MGTWQILTMLLVCIVIILLFPNGPLMLLIAFLGLFPVGWMLYLVYSFCRKRHLAKAVGVVVLNTVIWGGAYVVLDHLFANTYKMESPITDKQALTDFGMLKAEYRQAYAPTIEGVKVTCDAYAALVGYYDNITITTHAMVCPWLQSFIISMREDQLPEMFDEITGNYAFAESANEYGKDRTVRLHGRAIAVEHSFCRLIEDRPLPDTLTLHIERRPGKQVVDSIVFVKAAEHAVAFPPDKEEYIAERSRTIKERIKDKLLLR